MYVLKQLSLRSRTARVTWSASAGERKNYLHFRTNFFYDAGMRHADENTLRTILGELVVDELKVIRETDHSHALHDHERRLVHLEARAG